MLGKIVSQRLTTVADVVRRTPRVWFPKPGVTGSSPVGDAIVSNTVGGEHNGPTLLIRLWATAGANDLRLPSACVPTYGSALQAACPSSTSRRRGSAAAHRCGPPPHPNLGDEGVDRRNDRSGPVKAALRRGGVCGLGCSIGASDGAGSSASDGAMARVEVISGVERRRRWSDGQKRRLSLRAWRRERWAARWRARPMSGRARSIAGGELCAVADGFAQVLIAPPEAAAQAADGGVYGAPALARR